MFLKINSDNTASIVSPIVEGLFFEGGDLDSLIPKNTHTCQLTTEQQYELNKRLTQIKLGITCDGFDTNSVSEDFRDNVSMRSYPQSHPAIWGMISTSNGMSYRVHCSSREMNEMVKEYEKNQSFLESLVNRGYQVLVREDDDPLYDCILEKMI